MKKRPADASVVREMRAEYHLDYAQSRPNRFARDIREGATMVVLDPDVAAVFSTSESVNELLRSVISALPPAATTKRRANKALQPTRRAKGRRRG
jgi:hypothetical protein